jgi:4-amino-4-deoxy-L-arabinose transferase-like glycosyltransferase
MEKRSAAWIILAAILLLAGVLRLWGVNWDDGIGAHPDERYIAGVVESLRWPSQLSPFEFAPDYAYGHLPLYLLSVIRVLVRDVDILMVGRVLAALFDMGTVALTFALGQRACDDRVGLLAAGFVACSVLHVQQAHFYTVDALLAFFTVGTLLFLVRLAQDGRPMDAGVAGVWAGLALGTKASAALLALPVIEALVLVSRERWGCIWRFSVAAIAVFGLTNPFALIELSAFVQNLGRQAAIVRGILDVPYTRQYRATLPYIYPIAQQGRWGLGWLPTLAAFVGLGYSIWRGVQTTARRGERIILIWVLPSFAFIGALYVKLPRYLLPLMPLLAIQAAGMIVDLARLHRRLVRAFRILLLGSMLLRCVMLVVMYRVPHPWVSASKWFYENAKPGSVVATEEWDHPLPVDSTDYDMRVLPVFDEESTEKWGTIEGALAEANYVVIASRRGYATLAGMPDRYPRTARYYERLFEGDLGFQPVACFGRFPSLGSVALVDDPTAGLPFSLPELCGLDSQRVFRLGHLDESFVVYDHPQVLVFGTSE